MKSIVNKVVLPLTKVPVAKCIEPPCGRKFDVDGSDEIGSNSNFGIGLFARCTKSHSSDDGRAWKGAWKWKCQSVKEMANEWTRNETENPPTSKVEGDCIGRCDDGEQERAWARSRREASLDTTSVDKSTETHFGSQSGYLPVAGV